MASAALLLPPQAAYTDGPIFRLTVDQYHDLIDRGKLTPDDPVELIEGMLVFKMPENPPHETAIGLLTDILTPILPKGWHLRTQASVTLDDGEPEPDAAIVRGGRMSYASRHPMPPDIGLLIEVADSTLSRDRGIKLRSYARASVICYWIVNLVDRQIEVFTDPEPSSAVPRYRQMRVFRLGEMVPLSVEAQAIGQVAVSDIFQLDRAV